MAHDSGAHYIERPAPPGQRAWIARVQRTAEGLGIIPAGVYEIEFNVTPTRIHSIEYWSSIPRTQANHTEALIPEEHQRVFDNFAAEFVNLLRASRAV